MPRAFLPRPAPGTSYPIKPAAPGDFAAEDATLLATIGRNMGVARAKSDGRVPNPASRAYGFYAALFGLALSQPGNQPDADEARLVMEGRRARAAPSAGSAPSSPSARRSGWSSGWRPSRS
jgi:hypothetical protein